MASRRSSASAAERGLTAKAGTTDTKAVDEALELGIILAPRKIRPRRQARRVYDRLVDLYNRQPRLGSRTSTSMADQPYSTSVPLGYALPSMGCGFCYSRPTGREGRPSATWAAYVQGEFGVGRSQSYQLVDQGHVIGAVRKATDILSPMGDISKREARDIKLDLLAVTAEIKARVEAGEENGGQGSYRR